MQVESYQINWCSGIKCNSSSSTPNPTFEPPQTLNKKSGSLLISITSLGIYLIRLYFISVATCYLSLYSLDHYWLQLLSRS
jgi:hypothetical protein